MFIDSNTFSGITLACIPIALAVLIFEFKRTRAATSFHWSTFRTLMIITVIELFLEYISFVCLKIFAGTESLLPLFVGRAYLIMIAAWSAVFALYVVSIDSKKFWMIAVKHRSLLILVSSIIVAVIVVILFTAPMWSVYDEGEMYFAGVAVDGVLVAIVAACVVAVLTKAFLNRRRLNRRYTPVALAFILLMIAFVVRLIDPAAVIFGLIYTVVVISIAFTIENPDRKMLAIEKKAKNALRRADKTKDEFLSLASHQLRTPLTTVQGYGAMLLENDFGELTPKQKSAVEEVHNSAVRMSVLVNDLLNVSRLQAGRFVINRNRVDMVGLVRDEIDQAKMLAGEHDIKLVYDGADSEKIPPLSIDRSKIGEVIANMLDNAIFYSPKGSSVKIELKAVDGRVELRVIDHGIGVPKAEQDNLFTKFFRATNSRTKRPDGTGIGLFLAKKVISEHGGEIIFHSEEGKGSTFGFSLPIAN